jgi:hypothetical protein
MALPSERVALDHATLIAVERTVDGLIDEVRQLTREVDGMDTDPTYTCDCSCDEELRDLRSDLDQALGRIVQLEVMLTQGPGTTT